MSRKIKLNDDQIAADTAARRTTSSPILAEWKEGDWGRISQALLNLLTEDKNSGLFVELDDADLVRGSKMTPIKPSSIEFRIVYALAAIISRPEELARGDVRRKIARPYAPERTVERVIPVELLTRMIYGSNRRRERETICKALRNLAAMDLYIESSGCWLGRRVPLIQLGTKDGKGIDRSSGVVEIMFDGIFFEGLDNCYTPICPRTLFAAWRKAGRGTELSTCLLAVLQDIYAMKKRREVAIRSRVKQAAREETTAADIERRVRAEVQRKKLQYTRINVETLKRKIERDYESKDQYAAAFWRDLDAAIEGMKEIGIITAASSTAATAQPGTKRKLRPRRMMFTINLDYDKAATACPAEVDVDILSYEDLCSMFEGLYE